MSHDSSRGPQVGADARRLATRATELIPGGSHTYAKGLDQYPANAPPLIARGAGCHVWDLDGNEYIEFGMGLRAVTLGHGHPEVVAAAANALAQGTNFTRPSPLEGDAAEALLSRVPAAAMAKFCKNGSDATSAAVRLSRAFTGRDLVALCADQPFFSGDDWFIGTTLVNAGVPEAVRALTVTFRYNDLDGLRALFDQHPGIACVMMEGETSTPPKPGYLAAVHALCRERGAVFVLDENIAGFRFAVGGAQEVHGVAPDLSVFGKGLTNGIGLSALVGRREIMERGGLDHPFERVFLLSTTHGAESAGLAAALTTMDIYRREPVIETLYARGAQLRAGVTEAAKHHGLAEHVVVAGRDCNLVFGTRDRDGKPSQPLRTLFMQEMIRGGVIGPSFVVSYAHTPADIDATIEAVDGACKVYAAALADGVERFLVGPPTKVVYRRYNG